MAMFRESFVLPCHRELPAEQQYTFGLRALTCTEFVSLLDAESAMSGGSGVPPKEQLQTLLASIRPGVESVRNGQDVRTVEETLSALSMFELWELDNEVVRFSRLGPAEAKKSESPS